MEEGILRDNIYRRAVEKNIVKKNKCDEDNVTISLSSFASYRDIKIDSYDDKFHFCVLSLIEAANNLRIRSSDGRIYAKINILIPEHYTENELKSIIILLNEYLTLSNIKIAECSVNVWNCITYPIMNAEVFLLNAENVKRFSFKEKDIPAVAFGEIGISYVKAALKDISVFEKCKKRFSDEYISEMDYDLSDMLTDVGGDVIQKSKLIINSSECGINGTLWKLAELSDCGFEVDYKRIPVKQSVIELCELLKCDPYNMHSLGSGIILTEYPDEVVKNLADKGIISAQIGTLTKEKSKIILGVETRSNMNRPKKDEIYGI
ncbi:AIR synthase-related protein [Howardella ureilytica]